MAIYRGTGSASSTSDQATIDEVTTQATNAANSATSAASSASSAASSASSASSSATSAATSATTATNKASEASASASAASDSAGLASTSETNASDSETAASLSASQAAASATNASGSQTAAETAQAAAETAQTAAETAQTAAETAESNVSSTISSAVATATADAEAAQTAAETAATNSATSATNAANSATASANSATASATSATAAQTAQTNAETAETNAEAALDEFTDLYLGVKSSAPTLDNDGDALQTGALYYDSTAEQLYIWDGSAWDQAAFSVSGAVTSFNTRTGAVTLSSGDVTTALGYTPATAAQGTLADSAVQPGDNVSGLTNDSGYVVQSDIDTSIANLVDSAPAALDTLNELAAALGDDANFSTTVTNSIATKVSKSGDTMTGDLSFGDNDKAIFGAGSDLQIYHTGSESIISDAGTGNLKIYGENLELQATSTGETYFNAVANGAVTLYHNNSAKLATTSTGIEMSGYTDPTIQFKDSQNWGNNAAAIGSHIGSIDWIPGDGDWNGTDRGGQIHTEFSSSFGTACDLVFSTGTAGAGTSQAIRISSGNDISFYEDTGTTPKLFWDASTERLGIGTSSPASTLHINGGGTNESPHLRVTAARGLIARLGDTSGLVQSLFALYDNDGSTQIVKFISGGSDCFINTGGNVGIGTSSPSSDAGLSRILQVGSATDTSTTIVLKDDDGDLELGSAGGSFRVYDDGLERMRIDSSGNVLVGNTSYNSNNIGSGFGADGFGYHTRDGSQVLSLQRKTSDGEILNFRKDGTTVGSIASSGGTDLAIGSGDTGFRFIASANEIIPWNASGNTTNGDAIDIGKDTQRFKDLHLSGTANAARGLGATHTTTISSGTPTPDYSAYTNFVWTLSTNVNLGNPSDEAVGQSGVFVFIHSGAARTVSLGSEYETVGGAGLTLSGTAGATDVVPYFVAATGRIILGQPLLAVS